MTEAADTVSGPGRGRVATGLYVVAAVSFLAAFVWATWSVEMVGPPWLISAVWVGYVVLTALAQRPWGRLRHGWGLSEVLTSDRIAHRPRATWAINLLAGLGCVFVVTSFLPPLLTTRDYPKAAIVAAAVVWVVVLGLKRLRDLARAVAETTA